MAGLRSPLQTANQTLNPSPLSSCQIYLEATFMFFCFTGSLQNTTRFMLFSSVFCSLKNLESDGEERQVTLKSQTVANADLRVEEC